MKIRKRSDASRHENTPACKAYEYRLPTTEMDAALIELSGRYPETGWVMNTACTSLVHVINGHGFAYFTDGKVELAEDSQLLVEKDEKYALEGEMKLLFAATPAWSSDQARNVQ